MAEPWSKFFWSDYEADEGLRVCSLAAQGLWMRMLCLMARATPKGELRIAGEPCTVQDLARLVSADEETVDALCGELRRRGVFSVTRAGVIYSRRLRNDAIISRKRAESGAKGAAVTNRKYSENHVLPQQNSGKGSGKSPAPEARSQIPEEERTPLPPIDDDDGGGKAYAFSGTTIRLNQADLDRWKSSYHAIPDIVAELRGLDDWFDGPGKAKRSEWFYITSRSLGRKHQESLAAIKGGQSNSGDYFDHVMRQRAEREEWARQAAQREEPR